MDCETSLPTLFVEDPVACVIAKGKTSSIPATATIWNKP